MIERDKSDPGEKAVTGGVVRGSFGSDETENTELTVCYNAYVTAYWRGVTTAD